MKRLLAALTLLAMTALARADTRPFTLVALMETLQGRFPSAQVTARFSDWRTVSRYRSHAGLHLGYDIALPGGSPVPAAWAGRVVAVTPWWGTQYGITVESGGIETTYGHLEPMVSVGQTIEPGQSVGRTVIDHVDVKMRDSRGAYLDFGQGFEGTTVSPEMTREAREAECREAMAQVAVARSEAQRWKGRLLELKHAQSGAAPLIRKADEWEKLYQDGAVSRHQIEDMRRQRADVSHLERRLAEASRRGRESQAALSQARSRLARLGGHEEIVAVARPMQKKLLDGALLRLVDEGALTRSEAERLSRLKAESRASASYPRPDASRAAASRAVGQPARSSS